MKVRQDLVEAKTSVKKTTHILFLLRFLCHTSWICMQNLIDIMSTIIMSSIQQMWLQLFTCINFCILYFWLSADYNASYIMFYFILHWIKTTYWSTSMYGEKMLNGNFHCNSYFSHDKMFWFCKTTENVNVTSKLIFQIQSKINFPGIKNILYSFSSPNNRYIFFLCCILLMTLLP